MNKTEILSNLRRDVYEADEIWDQLEEVTDIVMKDLDPAGQKVLVLHLLLESSKVAALNNIAAALLLVVEEGQ